MRRLVSGRRGQGRSLPKLPGRSDRQGFAFVQVGDQKVAVNSTPSLARPGRPRAARTAGTPLGCRIAPSPRPGSAGARRELGAAGTTGKGQRVA